MALRPRDHIQSAAAYRILSAGKFPLLLETLCEVPSQQNGLFDDSDEPRFEPVEVLRSARKMRVDSYDIDIPSPANGTYLCSEIPYRHR